MTSTIFGKVWGALVLLLALAWSMFLGMDLQSSDWREAIIDGIMLAFWVFMIIWLHFMSLREQKADMEYEQSKKKLDEATKKFMDELLDGIRKSHEDDHDARLEKALDQATLEAKKGSHAPLKPSQYSAVEKRFHEITGDHYLKLKLAENGKTDVYIGEEPFVKKSPAPKKPTTKKTETKKGDK